MPHPLKVRNGQSSKRASLPYWFLASGVTDAANERNIRHVQWNIARGQQCEGNLGLHFFDASRPHGSRLIEKHSSLANALVVIGCRCQVFRKINQSLLLPNALTSQIFRERETLSNEAVQLSSMSYKLIDGAEC